MLDLYGTSDCSDIGWARRRSGLPPSTARNGASIRGKVMLKIDPSALAKLLAGKRIAVVSGTNGKTTTTHFLAAALRTLPGSARDGLVHNADGANLHHGLASALSQQPGRRHRDLGKRRTGRR